MHLLHALRSFVRAGSTCMVAQLMTGIDGTLRALPYGMVDDARNEVSTRPAPTSRTCPQCLNPHTVVANERYRGLMRFCPMCDHSWVIGQVSDDNGRSKREDCEDPVR